MKIFETNQETMEAIRVLSQNPWDALACSHSYMGNKVNPYSDAVFTDGPRIQIGDRIYYFWSEDYRVSGGDIVILEIRYHSIGGTVQGIRESLEIPELATFMQGGVTFKKLECLGLPYPSDDPEDNILFDYGFLLEKKETSLLVWSEAPGTLAWTLSKRLIDKHINSISSIRDITFDTEIDKFNI